MLIAKRGNTYSWGCHLIIESAMRSGAILKVNKRAVMSAYCVTTPTTAPNRLSKPFKLKYMADTAMLGDYHAPNGRGMSRPKTLLILTKGS